MALAAATLLVEDAWAGKREGLSERGDSQHSYEQSRQDTPDTSRSELGQNQRGSDDGGQRGASDGGQRSGSGQDRDGGPGRGRDGDTGTGPRERDRDGPPATLLDLIKRMAGPGPKGHAVFPPAELGSSEILGVGLNSAAIARARGLGFGITHGLHMGNLHGRVTLLEPPPGLSISAARDLLRAELPSDQFGLNYAYRPYHNAAGAEGMQPLGVRRASAGGCDAARCYGPAVIGWQPGVRACTKHARIGVIDTLVDLDHPAFKGRNIETGNFRPSGTDPATSRHGTGVLAVLAGSPSSGTPGLAPDAHYFSADVYRAGQEGEPVTDTLSLLRAIDWLSSSGVDLINMSLSGPHDELLRKAIVDLSARGTLFVAAAGNGGPAAPPSYPAAYPEVVAVTAIDRDLRGYIHANHGDYIDIAAPGVGIWTALPDGFEGYLSGTSLAAPHATAILAAVAARVREKSKEGYLRALLIRDLGPKGRDRIYGRGLALAPAECAGPTTPGDWVTSIIGDGIVPSAAYK